MALWRRCGACRRVLDLGSFPDDGQTCRACVVLGDVATTAVRTGESGTRVSRKGPARGTVKRPDASARSRAVNRLIEVHREEYDRLFAEEMERARAATG